VKSRTSESLGDFRYAYPCGIRGKLDGSNLAHTYSLCNTNFLTPRGYPYQQSAIENHGSESRATMYYHGWFIS